MDTKTLGFIAAVLILLACAGIYWAVAKAKKPKDTAVPPAKPLSGGNGSNPAERPK